MFKTDIKDNIINLQRNVTDYEVGISSITDDGKYLPYRITYVSNKNINVSMSKGIVTFVINLDKILKEEFVIFENYDKEKLVIKMLPNTYYMEDRTYKFKITSYKELEDGSIKVKIFSKVNDMDIGWKCTYGNDGQYIIFPSDSETSTHVIIKHNMTVVSDFTSKIIFKQDESGNEIELNLLNTKKGIYRKKVG